MQRNVFMLEVALFRDFAQDSLDLSEFAGFGNVVKRPQPHGIDGRFHAGVAGHHDGLGVRRQRLELFKNFNSRHARHAQIKNGHVKRAFLQGFDAGAPIRANRDLMPQSRQFGTHEFLQ